MASKGIIPSKRSEANDLAVTIGSVWESKPEFTVKGLTVEQFKTTTLEHGTLIQQTEANTAERRAITQKLGKLDNDFNKGAARIRKDLKDEYGDEAPAILVELGINIEGNLPNDRDSRLRMGKKLQSGLANYSDFNPGKYTVDWWNTWCQEYEAAWNRAKVLDGEKSNLTSQLTTKHNTLTKYIRRIHRQLQADYMDDPAQLRVWGFQKEKM